MKKIIVPGMLICLSILISCGGSTINDADKKATTDDPDSVKVDNSGPKKFELKSGIITYKTTVMGTENEMTISWDQYGALQASEMKLEVDGRANNMLILNDGVYSYSIDLGKKAGTRTKVESGSADNLNYNALTDEAREKYSITEEGTGDVLGRSCKIFSMNVSEMGMKMSTKVWVWKGIPLKTESATMGIKTIMEAVKVEENPSIPVERFKIPDGITITDGPKIN